MLLAEQASVEPGRPFTVGLRMKMRHGWHTYWTNPGDAGLPLRITWDLPEGFSAGPIAWPTPERMPESTLMSYGYGGEILLPIEIVPPARIGTDSVTLAGTFDWLECADVCVPASATLRLSLPVRPGQTKPGPDARAFAKARERLPSAPTGWTFTAEAGARAISLTFSGPPGTSAREAYLFVDQPLVADHAAPQGFESAGDGYRITVPPAPNAQGAPERLTGVLVVEGRAGSRSRTAVQVDVPVRGGDPAPAPAQTAGVQPTGPPVVALAVAAVAGLGLFALRYLRRGRKKSRPEPEPNQSVDGI
jgi:thiol:disulfide interchange protein DsbD